MTLLIIISAIIATAIIFAFMHIEVKIIPRGTASYTYHIPRIPIDDPLKVAKKIKDEIELGCAITIVNKFAVKHTIELAEKGYLIRGVCIKAAGAGTRMVEIANSGGISGLKK